MTDAPRKCGFWRTLLTEDDDNRFWGPVAVFGGVLVASLIAYTAYDLVVNKHFSAQDFGLGAAALLTSIGAGAGIKAKLGA